MQLLHSFHTWFTGKPFQYVLAVPASLRTCLLQWRVPTDSLVVPPLLTEHNRH